MEFRRNLNTFYTGAMWDRYTHTFNKFRNRNRYPALSCIVCALPSLYQLPSWSYTHTILYSSSFRRQIWWVSSSYDVTYSFFFPPSFVTKICLLLTKLDEFFQHFDAPRTDLWSAPTRWYREVMSYNTENEWIYKYILWFRYVSISNLWKVIPCSAF